MISINLKSKRIVLAFLLFVMAAVALFGQKQWTLQECINYALENNIQIKRQELQTQTSKINYNQAFFQQAPNLNANGSHNLNFGRSVDRFTNEIITNNVTSDNFSLEASLLLFAGFQVQNTIQQNKYILEQSLQDYEKIKNDICLRIATVYLQILFNKEALDIADKQLEVTRSQSDKTEKLVNAGSKAKGDLLQIKAQEANEVYNVTNARNNLKISLLTLSQLLELSDTTNMDIVQPDSLIISDINILTNVSETYDQALNHMPEVKSAEYGIKSAQKGLDIARGQYLPTLNLSAAYYTGYSNARKKSEFSGSYLGLVGYTDASLTTPVNYYFPAYSSVNYPFLEQLKDNNSKAISLSLSVPIFNRFQTKSNVSKARIRILDAQYASDQTKKDLYQEIKKAHADALAAYERLNSANEAVLSNEEAFKYVQQKYDLGVVNTFDYNLAKNDLLKAKSNFIQAKYEYVFKIKVLDFYKGVPINL